MSGGVTDLEREIPTVSLGAPADTCFACRAPLAEDQRYCLNCGERRGEPRVPLHVETLPVTAASPLEAERRPGVVAALLSRPMSIGAAVAGTAMVLLALLIGVAIGNSGDSGPARAAAPARPQVITVATQGTATPSAGETFTSDWPEGTTGYTVQLQTISKDSSDVAAVASAKSDAQSKGAPDVGALDSDDFASLDSGNYVVYSGVFDGKTAAKKALKKLEGKFPDAQVVAIKTSGHSGGAGKKVKKSQLKELQDASPQEYQKKSKKLPDKLKTPGKAPPKDKKKPGGGGDVETIG
jgi:hypothetical protein